MDFFTHEDFRGETHGSRDRILDLGSRDRGISARFLPRYAAGIFPKKDPAGKTGHLGEIPAGSRWVPRILAGSRRDPATHFTRVLASKYGGGNLALCVIRIPNCVIHHSTTKSVRILQWLIKTKWQKPASLFGHYQGAYNKIRTHFY